jgi:hypothetical protein
MNTNPRARRLPFVAAAATLAALALLVAACGSSSSSGSAPSSNDTASSANQKALAYAQCMRNNGVPNFPDPNANGRFPGLSHQRQGTPAFQAAQQACRNRAPGGNHMSEIGTPAFIRQFRVFARCMRANGLPTFPDPDSSGRFMGEVQALQADPAFPRAFAACQSKLPNMGGHSGP